MYKYTFIKGVHLYIFSNMNCKIDITSPAGTYITMISISFDFGPSPCSYDKVSIYDGGLIAAAAFGYFYSMVVQIRILFQKF